MYCSVVRIEYTLLPMSPYTLYNLYTICNGYSLFSLSLPSRFCRPNWCARAQQFVGLTQTNAINKKVRPRETMNSGVKHSRAADYVVHRFLFLFSFSDLLGLSVWFRLGYKYLHLHKPMRKCLESRIHTVSPHSLLARQWSAIVLYSTDYCRTTTAILLYIIGELLADVAPAAYFFPFFINIVVKSSWDINAVPINSITVEGITTVLLLH